jgi:hypothetical protein
MTLCERLQVVVGHFQYLGHPDQVRDRAGLHTHRAGDFGSAGNEHNRRISRRDFSQQVQATHIGKINIRDHAPRCAGLGEA